MNAAYRGELQRMPGVHMKRDCNELQWGMRARIATGIDATRRVELQWMPTHYREGESERR